MTIPAPTVSANVTVDSSALPETGSFSVPTTLITDINFLLVGLVLAVCLPLAVIQPNHILVEPSPEALRGDIQVAEQAMRDGNADNAAQAAELDRLRMRRQELIDALRLSRERIAMLEAELPLLSSQPGLATAPVTVMGTPTVLASGKKMMPWAIRQGRVSSLLDETSYVARPAQARDGTPVRVMTPVRQGETLAETQRPGSTMAARFDSYDPARQFVVFLIDGSDASVATFHGLLKGLRQRGLGFGWEPLGRDGVVVLGGKDGRTVGELRS